MDNDLTALADACRTHDLVLAEAIGMIIKEIAEIKPASRPSLAAGLTAIGQQLAEGERTAGGIMLGKIRRSAGMA